jgi:RNA polymerase sigma-70 factor (ECF subfamily)
LKPQSRGIKRLAVESCLDGDIWERFLSDTSKLSRFEAVVLVHLDAAYNLARWLTRDASGADDAVQDACLRAFRFFDSLQGPSPKAWFMAVVRNACLDWLKDQRLRGTDESYDDELHAASAVESTECTVARDSDARWVQAGIAALPREYREVLVLRELEELSYKEISAIVDVPIGTVMSRLSRGRDLLQQRLLESRERKRS